ncbi:MAG: hypothetical protein ACP5D7_03055 [Limnospira sp.]
MTSIRGQTKFQIVGVENGEGRSRPDQVTTEEPLEIRLNSPQKPSPSRDRIFARSPVQY